MLNSSPSLSDSEKTSLKVRALQDLEKEQSRRPVENRLAYYTPYPKQARFHAAGAASRARGFLAGQQHGETLPAGVLAALGTTPRFFRFCARERAPLLRRRAVCVL